MLAGSIAGASEHILTFPIDTMKTFLQAEGQTDFSQIQEIIRTEGRGRLFRGVSTMVFGCIPAHAAYFSIYEQGKIKFGADGADHAPVGAALSGM